MKKKNTKRRYCIRNWKQYNTALVERGSLTLWLDEAALSGGLNPTQTGRRGASRKYTDLAIVCGLTLGAVYGLALRQTQGLVASLLALVGAALPTPNYTSFCRRRPGLAVALPRQAKSQPLHVVVDSTGVKVYGEGEWKVRQHGWSKRRVWRKLHLGVDEATGEIVAAVSTTQSVTDGPVLPELLDQVPDRIEPVSGDGGYDKRKCYEAIAARAARAAIPPQRNARIWRHGNRAGARLQRDENLRRIRQVGRRRWKQETGYHRRSLAETTMFRLKTIFGGTLRARTGAGQATELRLWCAILNRMTHRGMPESYAT